MLKKITLCLSLSGMLLFTSCDELSKDVVCPSVFNIISVKVLTTDQEPVVLDEFSVFDKKSGKEFDLCRPDSCPEGTISGNPELGLYTIFHDHFTGKIGREKELLVEGKNQNIRFQEEFTVRDNGCNITKTAGPDTIYVP